MSSIELPRRRWTPLDYSLLVAAVLISAVVEWNGIQVIPSFDELWHLAVSTGRGTPVEYFAADRLITSLEPITTLQNSRPIWTIWWGLDGLPHPPLYFLFLRFWREVIGESDRAAYSLSILFQLVGVAFTFLAGRLSMNAWIGLLAALTLGCAQTQIYFAQEVRPYALSIALVAITLYVFTRIEATKPTVWTMRLLGVLPVLLVLTHYLNAGISAAIVVLALARYREHRRTLMLFVLASGLLFAIAWFPFMVRQLRQPGPAGDFLAVDKVDYLHELGLLACSPFRLIADRNYFFERGILFSGILYLLPWFLCRRFAPLWAWTTCLCAAVAPVVLLDIFGKREHMEVVRYFSSASPALVLVFAGTAWAMRRDLSYLFSAVLLFTGVIYNMSGNWISFECISYQASVDEVRKRVAPGDAIIAFSGAKPSFVADMLLLTCAHSPDLVGHPVLRMTRPMSLEQVHELPPRSWMLAGPIEGPVEAFIPGATVEWVSSVDFGVHLYRVTPVGAVGVDSAPNKDTNPATAPAGLGNVRQ